MREGGLKSCISAALALALSLLSAASGPLWAQGMDAPAVLMIARDRTARPLLEMMIQKEVLPMIRQLNEAGFTVVVASESGSLIEAGSARLKVDTRLAEVEIQDFVGVIIPCLGNDRGSIPLDALAIIKDACNLYLPLAAQQSGVELLGAAGVLRGRDYAIEPDSRDLIEGGSYKGMGVVRDGNIVTSGACPNISRLSGFKDGTDRLVASFIGLLVQ